MEIIYHLNNGIISKIIKMNYKKSFFKKKGYKEHTYTVQKPHKQHTNTFCISRVATTDKVLFLEKDVC